MQMYKSECGDEKLKIIAMVRYHHTTVPYPPLQCIFYLPTHTIVTLLIGFLTYPSNKILMHVLQHAPSNPQ